MCALLSYSAADQVLCLCQIGCLQLRSTLCSAWTCEPVCRHQVRTCQTGKVSRPGLDMSLIGLYRYFLKPLGCSLVLSTLLLTPITQAVQSTNASEEQRQHCPKQKLPAHQLPACIVCLNPHQHHAQQQASRTRWPAIPPPCSLSLTAASYPITDSCTSISATGRSQHLALSPPTAAPATHSHHRSRQAQQPATCQHSTR